jgi:CBS domain-containing protein
MNLGQICSREIVFIDREETVRRAAELMLERHVGALIVTERAEPGAHVLGIVTDRDLAIEALARGVDPQTSVGRVASPGLAALPSSAGLGEAIELMKSRGVRRLLVSAEDERLEGIVSADDLIAALGHEVAGLAAALRKGIDREAEERQPMPDKAPSFPIRVPLHHYA